METDAAPIRYSLNKRASVFLADDSDPFRRVSSQHFEGLRRCLCCRGISVLSNGHMLPPLATPAYNVAAVVHVASARRCAAAGSNRQCNPPRGVNQPKMRNT